MHTGVARDLSLQHGPISGLFPRAVDEAAREVWRLSEEQLSFFDQHGYMAGPRLLEGVLIEQLRAELSLMTQPGHPGQEFWYEYHSNESREP
ncbi:MAG: phytanoyl-CoA dioxygenase family protein, partial [Planctomyces sp.]